MSIATLRPVESFFAQRINQRTIRPQLFIAALAGIAFSLDIFAVYFSLDGARSIYGGTVLVLALLYMALPYVLWFVGTTMVYLIAKAVSARAEFNILWRTLGWGTVPWIGSGLALGAGRYLTLTPQQPCEQFLVCKVGRFVKLTSQVEGIYAFMSSVLSNSFFLLFFAISLLLFAITGYFWIIAAYQSTTLTRAGATIAAGIPYLLFTILFILVIF